MVSRYSTPIPRHHYESATNQQHIALLAAFNPTDYSFIAHSLTESPTRFCCCSFSCQSIISGTGVLRSDSSVDPQLLIKLSFREPVKLRGFKLLSTASSSTASTASSASVQSENPDTGATESAPRTIKLFVNSPNLSFADADGGVSATESIVLSAADVSGEREVKLKFVKYQNVTGLTLLVEDNMDESEVTVINRLDVIGATIAGMNVNDLKKIEDH